jgi:hypothetical protein
MIEFRSSCNLCRDVAAVITMDEWDDAADPAASIETTFWGGLECPACYLAYCNGCLATRRPTCPAADCPILPPRRLT